MVYVKRSNLFIIEDIQGEVLLFRTENGETRGHSVTILNEAGAFLWNALFEPISKEKLAELLSQKYKIEIKQARNDVNEFLKKCEDEDMVQMMDY